MESYYVNKERQDDGQHEVHKEWCIDVPPPEHQLLLGSFRDEQSALEEANFFFGKVTACTKCCGN